MSDSYRYVVSDIHGCINTFRNLVEEKIQLKKDDELFLLGDFIDRGPNSKGVIDYLMKLIGEGFSVHPLLGNHEDMFLKAFKGFNYFAQWMRNGAEMTLKSFKLTPVIDSLDMVPNEYVRFFESFRYYICLDDFILVHAGLNFENEDPFEDKEAMIWSREFQYEGAPIENRIIVHGHTPNKLNKIEEAILDKKPDLINIDGGCVYTKISGYGNLIALNLDTMEILSQKNID